MRRIIHVILGLNAISLVTSTYAQVQYVQLGNKVTIPCDVYGDRRSGKWLHRKDEDQFTTIVHEISGYVFQNKPLSSRKKTVNNFSLEIYPFTELDKGTYICQVCTSKRKCTDGKLITLLPQLALKTKFIVEGDQFSYSCLYNLTMNTDWRFEALGENTAISVNPNLTNKNVLVIPDVRPTNAGKYSYWGETSGHKQRMCLVTLCVLTVRAVKLTVLPQNCMLYCDVDVDGDEEGLAVVRTDKWNISLIGRVDKPNSPLSCRLMSSGDDPHTYSLEEDTATAKPYAVSSTTTDHRYSSRPPAAVLISISAALLFIITAILILIFFCVLRQRACKKQDRNSTGSEKGHSEGEMELDVIYSTVQVGSFQQQNAITSATECVYSEVKV